MTTEWTVSSFSSLESLRPAHRCLMSTFFTVYFLIKILGFFAKNPKIFSAYIAYTTGFFKKKKKKEAEFRVILLQRTQCVMTLKGEFRGHSLLTFLPWWCLTTRKSDQHDREVDFCFLGKLVVFSEVADVHVQVFLTQLPQTDPKVATDSTCRITVFSVFHVRKFMNC